MDTFHLHPVLGYVVFEDEAKLSAVAYRLLCRAVLGIVSEPLLEVDRKHCRRKRRIQCLVLKDHAKGAVYFGVFGCQAREIATLKAAVAEEAGKVRYPAILRSRVLFAAIKDISLGKLPYGPVPTRRVKITAHRITFLSGIPNNALARECRAILSF
nr:MAG TPA: hypothetical protein [Caudoviricetes sp.]